MTIFNGTEGDDIFFGGLPTDDEYNLLGGDDYVISETSGNDTYIGGLGNDLYKDLLGDDSYIFNIGDGNDTIMDMDGDNDSISFGTGISKKNVKFERTNDDVIVGLRETTDSITVKDWYLNDGLNHKIEYIRFNDNTSYSSLEVEQIIDGSLVVGTDYADILTGNSAINTLIGYAGDDVYSGGLGNDIFVDDSGNEVYNYNLGDGQDVISDYSGNDVIKFGAGITKAGLTFAQDGNNLVITLNANDKITVTNWYFDAVNKIEKLEFADGTYLTSEDIDSPVNPPIEPTILGTDGHDVLFGTLGNDTISGAKGNDIFHDHGGSDTYLFNKGDGLDQINDMSLKVSADVDTVLLGQDIVKENVALFLKGNDLVINYGVGDEVTVKNQTHERKGIEVLQLSDGQFLSDTQINQVIQDMTAYAKSNGVAFRSINDVAANQDLMAIIANSWQS